MPLSATWAKSSYSDPNGGDCVEARHSSADTVEIRDSKNPAGPVLSFSRDSWRAFTTAIRVAG